MRSYLCSLQMIRRGDWLIKASSFDDQILLFIWNECTMEQHVVMFYCENKAHEFIERLFKNDYQNCKASNR